MKSLVRIGLIVSLMLAGCNMLPQKELIKDNKGQIDLGSFAPNTIIPFQIIIPNPSSQPLTVKGIESSCSCTLIESKGKIIPAGEKLTFKGEISSSTGTGAYTRTVKLLFAEVPDPVEVKLRYWLKPPYGFVIQPMSFDFGLISAGKGVIEKNVKIMGESQVMAKFTPDLIQLPAGVKLLELSAPTKEPNLSSIMTRTAKLSFDFSQHPGLGSQNATIVIGPESKAYALRCYWQAAQPQMTTFFPQTLFLGRIKPQATWKTEFMVSPAQALAFPEKTSGIKLQALAVKGKAGVYEITVTNLNPAQTLIDREIPVTAEATGASLGVVKVSGYSE
jgi:Protein of unknown function (DUF1573)